MTTTPDRIEKRIELEATPERVWRALSSSREFGTWFQAKLDGEFAPGATVRGTITYPGYEHLTLEMTIERMDKERLFAFRWHPHAVEPGVDYSKEPTTLVEFRLEPSATGTVLVVTESGFASIPAGRRLKAFEMNSDGWAEQLENIERHVEVVENMTGHVIGRIEVKVSDRIARPVGDVFEAIVDPAKMTQYFISRSSGRMQPNTRVDWEWADVGAKAPIDVEEIEPNRKIVFSSPGAGMKTKVTLLLEPDGDRTKVTAIEGPFELTDEGVRKALDQNGGWTHFCCCLKAYLEHGINLRLGKRADDVA